MAQSDYYKTLTLRTRTTVNTNGAISYTSVDTTFQGFIGVLSANEILISQQMKLDAVARLLTESTLNKKDQIVDTSGYFSGEAGTIYEIVGIYNSGFDKYYDLKIVQSTQATQ